MTFGESLREAKPPLKTLSLSFEGEGDTEGEVDKTTFTLLQGSEVV